MKHPTELTPIDYVKYPVYEKVYSIIKDSYLIYNPRGYHTLFTKIRTKANNERAKKMFSFLKKENSEEKIARFFMGLFWSKDLPTSERKNVIDHTILKMKQNNWLVS